jgi:nucleoside-diphosphate-sugar epimerase
MSSITAPLGALPRRFRRQRLLIVGCGDVGQRLLPAAAQRMHARVLTSTPAKAALFRAAGARVHVGNLDNPASLHALSGWATHVLHLAPPPSQGWADGSKDPRTLALVRSLRKRGAPQVMVYASTTGVYGDCGGLKIDESRPVNPMSARAHRRVDAENAVRFLGRGAASRVSILRIPGIYALDREGGNPAERVKKGTPVLRREDDVFTNHIHATDLARACLLALFRGKSQRAYNICDNTELLMGDYFDLVADLHQLPRPERVARQGAEDKLSLMTLSFMNESRRLSNARMRHELRLQLRYPLVQDGLQTGKQVL